MRTDVDRYTVIAIIDGALCAFPEMRLGQILCNALGLINRQLFYMPDSEAMVGLVDYMKAAPPRTDDPGGE